MTRDQVLALFVRRQEAWNRRDAAALGRDYAPEGVVISAVSGRLEGRERIAAAYRAWFTAFPDLDFRSDALVIDGDLAALFFKATGTHSGEFLGLAPSGRRFDVSGVFLYELADGQIVHERRILDFTGLLVQIGILKVKPA